MKNFIAITVFDENEPGILNQCINSLLLNPVQKDIFVFDCTRNGIHRELKNLISSYNSLSVFLIREKTAQNDMFNFKRINLGISASLMRFKHGINKYASYTHIYQNMMFKNYELNTLIKNSQLYNSISPVIESRNGVELLTGNYDRYGVEFFPVGDSVLNFITGDVEDSYALNPKCFSLSNRYARLFRDFYYSDQDPIDYLNSFVYNYTGTKPKVDTNIFVHENLY